MSKTSQEEEVYWNDILEKFAIYTGNLKAFCNEHKLDKRKLYYRRTKAPKSKQPILKRLKLIT